MTNSITFLDKFLEPKLEIDSFKSLIWTERYNTNGDFEIYIPIDGSRVSNSLLTIDSDGKNSWTNGYASIPESKNLMFLEQFRINNDKDSGEVLIVTGRSLESILMRRIVWGLKVINGNLQKGVRKLLTENIIDPSDSDRRIPNFKFIMSDDPQITSLKLRAQYTGDNLYDVISGICKDNELGFKIEVNDDNEFEFSLYKGTDRSYSQETNDYVIFSKSSENLLSSEYLESNAFTKNVALIGGEGEGKDRRYASVGSGSGLDRREIFTDARDISSNYGDFVLLTSMPSDWSENWTNYYINTGTQDNPEYEQVPDESAPTWVENTYYEFDEDVQMDDTEYNKLLRQRGQKDLDENKDIQAFNGEIDPFSLYIFGTDFFMGDIVEVEDEYGHHSRTRVSEIVRSIDSNGFSVYPTFSLLEEDTNVNY